MVWDRFVRTFHWSLVAGIVLNYWFIEDGSDPHEWLGYAVLALVALRLIWGFVGPQPARFSAFVHGPRRVIIGLRDFSKEHRQHAGHTAPAGWMIVLLLTLVVGVGVTGWLQELDAFWGEDWPQDLHEWLSHTLLIAAGIHVSAVFLIQWRYRLPLLQSMLFGGKNVL